MTRRQAFAIIAATAVLAVLFVALSTKAPVRDNRPVPASVAQLGTGKPAMYEFSTNT